MSDLFVPLACKLGYATVVFTLAACAVWLVLSAARVRSPAIHRWAWGIVLLQGIVFWRLPVELPWPRPAAAHDAALLSNRPARVDDTVVALDPQASPLPSALEAGVPSPFSSWSVLPLACGVLLGVWLTGALAFAIRDGLACGRFWRMLARPPLAPDEWTEELVEICRELSIRRHPALDCTAQSGPALCWLPGGYRLLVPGVAWQNLTKMQRQAVLRHELAHYWRGDLWVSLLMRMAALAQWFNPLAWMALDRFEEAAEWACDDAVQAAAPDRQFEYLRALIQLSALPPTRSSLQAAIAGGSIPYRVRRLLSSDRKDSKMKLLTMIALTLAIGAAGLTQLHFAAAQAPENDTGLAAPDVVPSDAQAATEPAADRVAPDKILSTKTATLPAGQEAVIDMARVFKSDREFGQRQQALRDKQSRLQLELKQNQARLAVLTEKQRTTKDQELARLLLIELQAEQAVLQEQLTTMRKEMLDAEAAAYHEAFERIRAEVAKYAQEHGIRQVRRAQAVVRDDEPIDLKDRQAVLARLNRDIIYSAPEQIDITDAIIERLSRPERVKF